MKKKYIHMVILLCSISFLICCSEDKGTAPTDDSHSALSVTISNPVDSAAFFIGDSISFSGTGYDGNSSPLPINSFLWTSDNDGILGTGSTIERNDLSEGVHNISLTAVDGNNNTATDDVIISIVPEGDSPSAIIISPSEGASYVMGNTISFIGTGSDGKDGILPSSSLLWASDKDGVLGTGSSFSRNDLSENAHVISLVVTDSDGYTDIDEVSVLVISGGEHPTASISSPDDGSVYFRGESINFSGTGADSKDGVLPGSSLLWTSDKDGILGTGTSLTKDDLSENVHKITLTATDSDSNTDSDSISITVEQSNFEIITSSLPTGFTCSPYNIQLEATGGSEPYNWSVAAGSTLPAGMELTADGKLTGMFDNTGNYNFSLISQDSRNSTDEVALNLVISVPSNPSLAIFFDEEASTCCTETQAFATLDCYVYIMLDETQYDCAKGASFRIDLVDIDGDPIDASKYYYMYTDIDETRTISLGTISSGLALTFTNPMKYYGPIEVVKFGIMVLEDIDELAFRFGPNPNEVPERSAPVFMSCEDGYPLYEINGRDAAINY